MFWSQVSVLFKKSVILQVGGYQDLPGYEDYYLWLRVLNKYDGKNLDIPLVYARIGNNLMKRRQGYEVRSSGENIILVFPVFTAKFCDFLLCGFKIRGL